MSALWRPRERLLDARPWPLDLALAAACFQGDRRRSPAHMYIEAGARMSVDDLRAARIPRTWYARDALVRARSLIGCLVVHEGSAGAIPRVSRIVETEAYRGARDLACHARAGLTK